MYINFQNIIYYSNNIILKMIRSFTKRDKFIINSLHYYFSDVNLYKDTNLTSVMDDQGWIQIADILSFPRMKECNCSYQEILQV